jgi:AcrR family transcriptional regulator
LEVSDPRAERTREQISAAFAQMVMRRAYAQIRVSDITRKAHVGRATFYAHFASKDALLAAELRRITQQMIRPMHGQAGLADCTGLFAHLLHARDIYRSLMGGASRVVTERIVQDAIEERMAELLRQARAKAGVDADDLGFVPRFVASTVLALMAWALEHQIAPSPAVLQAQFQRLVEPACA